MIVIDASVAVKWFFVESGHAAAAALLRADTGLIAPALIRLEVLGALVRPFRLDDRFVSSPPVAGQMDRDVA